jgi:hypothetical protein
VVLLARVERLLGPGLVRVRAVDQANIIHCAVRCDGFVVAVGDIIRVSGVSLDDHDSDARIVGVGVEDPQPN